MDLRTEVGWVSRAGLPRRDEILIQSRDGKSLNRYFPELLEPLQTQLPARCVLDGEIVIAKNGGLDFEALQLRIHPAASRVKLLVPRNPGINRVLRPALRGRSGFAGRTVSKPAAAAGIFTLICRRRRSI